MLRRKINSNRTQAAWSGLRSGWLWAVAMVFLAVPAVPVSSQAQESPPPLARAQDIPHEVLVKNSLAASEIKNENYESALPHLRWLLDNAPTVYNSERIHRRAVTAYSAVADSTTDDSLKAAYLDTAFTILRTAPITFEDGGVDYDRTRWDLDFGNFLVKYRGRIDGPDDRAVDHFRAAYESDPENTDPYYIKMIVREYVQLGMIDQALSFMDEAEPRFGEDSELSDWFEGIRDQILRSPEDRIPYLEEKLARDSTDVEVVRELFMIYGQLERAAEMEAMGERLLELDPTTETYVEVADLKAENGKYGEAHELYTRALESAGEDAPADLKRDIEFKIALANYELGRLESARNHARRALRHDPKFGRAYVLIGDVLVKAVSESAFERKDKAVFWLAMDYYEKAASVDSSQVAVAREKVQQYRAYMPTDEEKFFAGWTTGDAYPIDYGRYAWVNETTRVR